MKAERGKDNKFLIAIVVVALLGISIGYAIISKDLIFNGTVNVKGNSWIISADAARDIVKTGKTTEVTAPSVTSESENAITISYSISLDKPGDAYSFIVPIKNTGTIDAILDTKTTTGLDDYVDYLDYKVELVDDIANPNDAVDLLPGAKLAAGTPADPTIIYVKITVTHKDDSQDNITANEINPNVVTTLHFIQDKNYSTTPTP